jgi:D-3-phosphoglycerate dehydrogenase
VSYKVLVLEGITDRGLEVLKAEGWQVDVKKAMPPAELAAIVEPYHAITIRSSSQITAEVLDAAKNLRVIGRPGVGVDNVDLAARHPPRRHGHELAAREPGLDGRAGGRAADGARAQPAPGGRVDQGGQVGPQVVRGVELHGKRIGVVGFGRIGREVAARCRALGMEVVAYDPFVSPAVAEAQHTSLVSLDELLQSSDFITLHTTLSKESRHLIGKEALAKVKNGVRIVNAARGELIDEQALLAALESGRVAGAALDVHAQEPPVDWKLAQHPRVVATPARGRVHRGGAGARRHRHLVPGARLPEGRAHPARGELLRADGRPLRPGPSGDGAGREAGALRLAGGRRPARADRAGPLR